MGLRCGVLDLFGLDLPYLPLHSNTVVAGLYLKIAW